MKRSIKTILPALVLIQWLSIISCSDMDDYIKYTEGKPRLYTGKVDSVMFMAGQERVLFYGLLTSDPKIKEIKIYWDNYTDSLVLDVERTSGIDTLEVSIPLAEGKYFFEVISYDEKGNPSLPVNESGSSYGNVYKQTLYNRAIKKAEKAGADAVIEWYNGDETSPFVQLEYTDSEDKLYTLQVPTTEMKTTLQNFKSMSQFSMQAYYLPETNAIDTFKVQPVFVNVNEDITHLIKNSGNPFLRADGGDGKWGTLKDWQYTPNIINQNGETAGGWSTDGGGVIHFESKDWGGDGVTNGKIFQTLSLPAGNYHLEFYSDGGGSDNFKGYFAAHTGTSLPDIERMDEAIAFHTWDQSFMGGTHTFNFTLRSPQTVTIGWVVSFGSTTWMHVNYVKLMMLAE